MENNGFNVDFDIKTYYEEQLKSCTAKYNKLLEETQSLRLYHYALIGILFFMAALILALSCVLAHKKTKTTTTETVVMIPVYEKEMVLTPDNLYDFLEAHNAYYPDILVAQAKLESGYFKSELAVKTNNIFGMSKAIQRDHVQSGIYKGYASYTTWMDSALDRILWDKHHFKTLPSRDQYLVFLNNYAEDSLYVQKIKSLL